MKSELEARSTSPIGGSRSDHSMSVAEPKTRPTPSQQSRTKGPPSVSAVVAALILKRNNRKTFPAFRSTLMNNSSRNDQKKELCYLCSPPTSPDYYRCRSHRARPPPPRNAHPAHRHNEKKKLTCLCSPPTSPGYYRCRYHREGQPPTASSSVVPPHQVDGDGTAKNGLLLPNAARGSSFDATPPPRVKLGLSRFCPLTKRVAGHHEP